jgi:hypothetical protein
MAGGPLMVVQLLLAIVIVILTSYKAIQFFTGKDPDRARIEKGLNAILFWGAFSVILGFLAHFMTLYKNINLIIHAGIISPDRVTMGFGESLVSLLFGLWIFMFSAVIWFFLRWISVKRLQRRSP